MWVKKEEDSSKEPPFLEQVKAADIAGKSPSNSSWPSLKS
jgi:hypothetical protein